MITYITFSSSASHILEICHRFTCDLSICSSSPFFCKILWTQNLPVIYGVVLTIAFTLYKKHSRSDVWQFRTGAENWTNSEFLYSSDFAVCDTHQLSENHSGLSWRNSFLHHKEGFPCKILCPDFHLVWSPSSPLQQSHQES